MPPKKDPNEELREAYEKAKEERRLKALAEQLAAQELAAAKEREESARRRAESPTGPSDPASDADETGDVKPKTEVFKSEKEVKMATNTQFDNPDPLSVEDAREVQRLLKSLAGYKGYIRQLEKRVKQEIDQAQSRFGSGVVADLEAVQASYKSAFDKLLGCIGALLDLEPERGTWGAGVDEETAKYEALSKKLYDAIKAARERRETSSAVGDAPPPASNVNQPRRMDDSLRPEVLTLSYTPAEFREWKKQFRAWYMANNMDNMLLTLAQQHFKGRLDVELNSHLAHYVEDTTAIFGVGSMEGMVDKEFKIRYPMNNNRLDYMRLKQNRGELSTDYIVRLNSATADGDILKITGEELNSLKLITGLINDELRKDLIEAKDQSYLNLCNIYTEYEANLRSRKGMSQPRANALKFNKHRSKSKSPRRKSPYQKGKTDSYKKSGDKKLCNRCGRNPDKHKDGVCWAADKKCNHCGKMGHIKPACMSLTREKKRAQSRSPSPFRAATVRISVVKASKPHRVVEVARTSANDGSTPRLPIVVGPNERKTRHGAVFKEEALPDTGATKTVVPSALMKMHGYRPKRTDLTITAANDSALQCDGVVDIRLMAGDVDVVTEAVVSPDVSEILVGWSDLQNLGVIPKDFPNNILVQRVSLGNGTLQERAEKLLVAHKDVFDSKPKMMNGPPMKIHMRTSANGEPIVPTHVLTARQIPLHFRRQADEHVQGLIEGKIIIPEPNPTEYCSHGFFVAKPDGESVRLVIDYQGVNKGVLRAVHPFPAPRDVLRSIEPESVVFCTLDAVQGYFQIPLDEESSKLTTFLLPSGRYRFTRAPMGLSCSSDEWCRRSDEALQGVKGCVKIVDDILIQAKSDDELLLRLNDVLNACQKHGITLSRKKMQVGNSVKFAGFIISSNGISADPAKLKAIKDFPLPTDVTTLRSFLGLANQLSPFIPDMAHLTSQLRPPLKKSNAFLWLEEHTKAFKTMKDMLSSSPTVRPFEPSYRTVLHTDASRLHGLGYALIQYASDKPNEPPRLVQCGSRSLLPAETRYATIELELLAIQYAIEKCKFYLYGCEFGVLTDHRPLLGLLAKPLADIANTRLQRIREKLTPYSFTIAWTPGKIHAVADALSRAPAFSPAEEGIDDDVNVLSIRILAIKGDKGDI